MPISTVSALFDALRRYHILEPSQLDALTGGTHSAEPRALAGELIRRGWLTAYQANQVLQGRAPDLLLGSYVLLERLGEGGMGQVFKARNWKLGRVVALKLIRKERLANEEAVRRFHREIRATAQLSHPNIVLAYDADEVNGTHFFVMEYVEGQDLARLVRQRGVLPIETACDYIRQAALGLQHAYERGLTHRDVKPANLLLSKQGALKILDLGLAQLANSGSDEDGTSTLTQEGMIMGTLDYIAPEQAADSHAVDIRADLYSLGCTFYFLLAGRVPFPGGKPVEKLYKHRFEEPEAVERLRPQVPPAVAAVVRKLMAKGPKDRYQTPAESLAALAPEVLAAWTGPVPHDTSQTPTDRAPMAEKQTGEPAPTGFSDLDLRDTEVGPDPPSRRRPGGRRMWRLGWVGLPALLGLALLMYLFLKPGSRSNEEQGGQERAAAARAGKQKRHEARQVLRGHTEPVLALAYSPDGGLLASAGQDRTVKLWVTATGRCLATLEGHTAPVHTLAFSPDGKNLASGGNDRAIHVWDPATFTQRWRIVTSYPTAVRGLTFALPSSDQVFTVGDDATLQWWSLSAGEQVGGRFLPVPGWSVASYRDGRHFALGLADGTVRLCTNDTRGEHFRTEHRGPVKGLAFSPDGKLVASGGADGLVKLWDVNAGEARATLEGHRQEVVAVAFSPDGKVLASGSADGTARLWDLGSGKEKAVLQEHTRGIGAVAFSLDGKTLAVGAFDGTVQLWDLPSFSRGDRSD